MGAGGGALPAPPDAGSWRRGSARTRAACEIPSRTRQVAGEAVLTPKTGELLVQRGLATPEQVEQARVEGRARGDNYRSGKDSGLALYYLWLTGEVMTHHRRNFDRVFDFRRNIVIDGLNRKATVAQAENYFARKALSFRGLSRARTFTNSFAGFIERRVSLDEAH